jgi:hypothetical protein
VCSAEGGNPFGAAAVFVACCARPVVTRGDVFGAGARCVPEFLIGAPPLLGVSTLSFVVRANLRRYGTVLAVSTRQRLIVCLCVSMAVAAISAVAVSTGSSSESVAGATPTSAVPDDAATSTAAADTADTADAGGGVGDDSTGGEQDCGLDCVAERVAEVTRREGVPAGFAYLEQVFIDQPQMRSSCHSLQHVVGRLGAQNPDMGFFSTDCQYGYLHGLLQGLGSTFSDPDAFVSEVKAYCARQSLDDAEACAHGVGHAAAVAAPADLVRAVRSCRNLGSLVLEGHCAGGALMEFGDDYLAKVGWFASTNSAASDNAAEATSVDGLDLQNLCTLIPEHLEDRCYERLWMFISPLYSDDFAAATRVCDEADGSAYVLCYRGFGGSVPIFLNLDGRYNAFWPPDSAAEASRLAEAYAEVCVSTNEPGMCMAGVLISTTSHILAYGKDTDLLPPYCSALPPVHFTECLEGWRESARMAQVDFDTLDPVAGW